MAARLPPGPRRQLAPPPNYISNFQQSNSLSHNLETLNLNQSIPSMPRPPFPGHQQFLSSGSTPISGPLSSSLSSGLVPPTVAPPFLSGAHPAPVASSPSSLLPAASHSNLVSNEPRVQVLNRLPPGSQFHPLPASSLHPPPGNALYHPPGNALYPPPGNALYPPPGNALYPPPGNPLHPPPGNVLYPPPGSPLHPPPGNVLYPPPGSPLHPPPGSPLHHPPGSPLHPPPGSPLYSPPMGPPPMIRMDSQAHIQGVPPFVGAPPPPQGMQHLAMPPQAGMPRGHFPFSQAQPHLVAQSPPTEMLGMPPLQYQATTGDPNVESAKMDMEKVPRPIPTNPTQNDIMQDNQPTASDYIGRDISNCRPHYMRCTMSQIPCTADLLTTSCLKFALLVQPLALPSENEEPIQAVDFGEQGPVRCSRCKGYMNPFMKFIDQGRRFICNFCGFVDETPHGYHCNLGPDGRRRDADERPELCRGTVEFVATKEFMVRDPMPAVYFFLIDVSMIAIQTGATAAACSSISQVIGDLPEGPRTMVGVATFDSSIHFYNLKRALQQPLMLIVPDIQDVYTPLETDVIVPLSECSQHLQLLLESIPTMFQDGQTAESAFGAAIKAAFLAMKNTGGKLLVFQSVLPSAGIGSLSAREVEGRSSIAVGDKEVNKLLQPADKSLKEMAIEFAEYQVCVDLFITAQAYVDVASISVISQTTGGQVYYYFPFSAISDPAKLCNDLRWNVTRPQGFEAVMRVRCSQGVQVKEYFGNFCKRIPTDVDLPGIDCDKTIMVTLKHDDKLQDGTDCAFQCALLYTTLYGQRRIRVITLSLPCTNSLVSLFRSADSDTQFVCFLKEASRGYSSSPPLVCREQVTNFCVNVLVSYRKYCASISSIGQLVLPEALKLLPLYTLALIKSAILRVDGRVDERSFWLNYTSSLSVSLMIPLVYPRLISLHDLDSQEKDGLPIPIPLTSEKLSDDGIYLLENGHDCLMYLSSSVDPHILQQLFGTSILDEIPSQFILPQLDNPLSKKSNAVINEIRSERCSYMRLKLCKKGDPSGMMFLANLVEDKVPTGGPSYVDFLVQVHHQIRSKIST